VRRDGADLISRSCNRFGQFATLATALRRTPSSTARVAATTPR